MHCTPCTNEIEGMFINDLIYELDRYAFAKHRLADVAYNAIAMGEESTEALEKTRFTNELIKSITIESGQILGHVKKWIRDDGNFPEEITRERQEAIAIELFDILFYWTYAVDSLGYTPENILLLGLKKIRGRQERGTQAGSGDER